MQNMSVSVLV